MKHTCDAPQADRLDLVRKVVEVVGNGATSTEAVAAGAQVAPRYALYCLHAARALGLLDEDEAGVVNMTQLGESLTRSPLGSENERDILRQALERSPGLTTVASLVLADTPPSVELVAESLMGLGPLSLSTALRRARTLLSWRRYLLPTDDSAQLPIRFGPVSSSQVTVPLPAPPEMAKADGDETTAHGSAPEHAHALPDKVEPPPSPDEANGETAAVGFADASRTVAVAEEEPAGISTADLGYLRRHIELGTAVLFTGAGFSLAARDGRGQPLPSGAAYARELWDICYPGEPFDNSSLQDIFEHAHRRHPKELQRSLGQRFTVDTGSLPEWYKDWFSFPWSRIYTVNVDDLELAVERRFGCPRPMLPISALSQAHGGDGRALPVIHLNGVASDGPDRVTFSVDQYSERIARQEPLYAQFAAEVLVRPFIFVGSPLEEPLLWSHIGLRRLRGRDSENELRAKSFLVSPELPRARRDKLRAYNVTWIKGTAETFATTVLTSLTDAAATGRARIADFGPGEASEDRGIVEVTTVADASTARTEFLMGAEPTWSDLTNGRAVKRDEDGERLDKLRSIALAARRATDPPALWAISATAGAGKTTLLMRTALHLTAAGIRVAWVGTTSDVSPSAIARYYRADGRPPVLIIDDAGRYGSELVPTLLSLGRSDSLALVAIGLRSYHQHLLDSPIAADLKVSRDSIGPLSNGDIDRLLELLEREKRLGALRSLTFEQRREAFREKASRQILVAMIEATSGERFEERVIQEWQEQEPVERYVYALVALATAHTYPLAKDEILLSCSGGPRELDALARLKKAHLLVDDDGRFRARHRVIAEKLVDELSQRGTQLERLVVGLTRALAIRVESERTRSTRPWRVLKRLLNHNTLLRLLCEIEPARSVYAELERHLDWDYHFWLQRGCLELESGDVRYAENFLHQSAALSGDDPLVQTALAHMQLRRAILNPSAPDSGDVVDKAFATLRDLIAVRGSRDYYPAHVFGSQVLGWTRHAALTPRARLALLREAREVVTHAVGMFRSRKELSQLLHDLQAALLQPV